MSHCRIVPGRDNSSSLARVAEEAGLLPPRLTFATLETLAGNAREAMLRIVVN